MPADTIIRGGRVVTSEGSFEGHVVIDEGKIVEISSSVPTVDASQVVDASGKLVLPGVVDPHVHIDEKPENRAGTYESESQAAAAGGVTTFIDFAFQGGDRAMSDPNADLTDGIKNKRAKQDESFVDFSLHGVLHRETPATFNELVPSVDLGVTSFKMFMSNYEIGVSNGFIFEALRELAELDVVALLHTEEPSICDALTDRMRRNDEGKAARYPDSRPPFVEAMAADTVLRMVRETGVKYYGVHTTCRESAEVIRRYQQELPNVRAETCTHYTATDRSLHDRRQNLPKIAPPLRTPNDVEAMFGYLEKGSLSVVSTDHAVYHRAFKQGDNWWEAPFGVNSLQYSLPVFYHEAVEKRGYSPSFVVKVMSTNPARTFGLPEKGTVAPGTDADIVVFDPTHRWTISEDDNLSNSTYSIYDGREVGGSVEKTFVRGTLVAEEGSIVADSPPGKFISREVPSWSA